MMIGTRTGEPAYPKYQCVGDERFALGMANLKRLLQSTTDGDAQREIYIYIYVCI